MSFGMSGDIKQGRVIAQHAMDPDYPNYYNLACADAEEGTSTAVAHTWNRRSRATANMIPGEHLWPRALKGELLGVCSDVGLLSRLSFDKDLSGMGCSLKRWLVQTINTILALPGGFAVLTA